MRKEAHAVRGDRWAARQSLWLSVVAGLLVVGVVGLVAAGREPSSTTSDALAEVPAFQPDPSDRAVVEFVVSRQGDDVQPTDLATGVRLLPPLALALPAPAPRELDEAGYEVVEVVDEVVALLPTRNRGWGGLVHRPGGRAVHVQVPHPFSDLGTPVLGGELFVASRASHLLVAGARRTALDGAADAAHAADLPFEAVHVALLPRVELVVQVHGYASGSRPHLDAEVVVSAGPGDQAGVVGLAESLRAAGLEVCVPGSGPCDDLAGRANQQGATALQAGVDFLHLEVADTLRSDATRRGRLVAVVAAWMGART